MQRYVIIVAGGAGRRFGGDTPKQFMLLCGKPILLHTLDKFHSYSRDINIVVVLPAEHIELWHNICRRFAVKIPHVIAEGGHERFFSVLNGLRHIPDDALVAVHDGVRPFVSFDTLDRCFAKAEEGDSAVPVMPLTESVRLCSDKGNSSFDRSKLRTVQTPQVFRASVLKEAYRQPYSELFTDDASVVEALGHSINLVEGNRENIKITTPLDLAIGEIILRDGK